MGQVAEGVNTCRVAVDLAERLGVDVPLTRAVYQLVHEGRSAPDVLEELMALPPVAEEEAVP